MKRQTEKQNSNKKNKILLIQSIAMVVVTVLVLGGLTRAWFTNQTDIATLVSVKEPTPISIRGAHGEAMTQLDLSYTEDDKIKDKNGNVTGVEIKRVISVSSDSSQHKLEIVHTTNMKGLTFNVYEAKEVVSSGASNTDTDGTITSGEYTYSYNTKKPLTGSYLNKEKETNNYKYADKKYHSENYNDYLNVQSHAEPLYYLIKTKDSDQKETPWLPASLKEEDNTTVDTQYLTYYVLEISWEKVTDQKEAEKETDMFYVLATQS